jgi:hypothetical protein
MPVEGYVAHSARAATLCGTLAPAVIGWQGRSYARGPSDRVAAALSSWEESPNSQGNKVKNKLIGLPPVWNWEAGASAERDVCSKGQFRCSLT